MLTCYATCLCPFLYRQNDLRNASPRSSVLSLPRSHAGTSAGGSRAPSMRGSGATGPKKVDRVKRYQELQQGWSKDKCVVAARAGTAGCRLVCSQELPVVDMTLWCFAAQEICKFRLAVEFN